MQSSTLELSRSRVSKPREQADRFGSRETTYLATRVYVDYSEDLRIKVDSGMRETKTVDGGMLDLRDSEDFNTTQTTRKEDSRPKCCRRFYTLIVVCDSRAYVDTYMQLVEKYAK